MTKYIVIGDKGRLTTDDKSLADKVAKSLGKDVVTTWRKK